MGISTEFYILYGILAVINLGTFAAAIVAFWLAWFGKWDDDGKLQPPDWWPFRSKNGQAKRIVWLERQIEHKERELATLRARVAPLKARQNAAARDDSDPPPVALNEPVAG